MSAFIPSHDPPTWWERALTHPMIWVAMWSVLAGAMLAVSPLLPEFTPSPSLGRLPGWTAAALAVALIGGGLSATVGLLNDWENRSRAWSTEQAGWVLIAAGWASYAVVVIQNFPGSQFAWGTGVIFVVIAATRVTALHLMARRTRARLREIRAAATGEQEVVPRHE
ncbi:hypothetical protein [Kocuria sp.]|uniref:hypothetical protein n=1 Tax=Kocuria sp. TaxID=1871328 RepID=UPI0026DBE202|nr:hypothetical protein [Kocuria sp.]MDO4920106.1 hypothetical protein [Kocuria sp.]